MTLRSACLVLLAVPACALPLYDYDPPGSSGGAGMGASNNGGQGAQSGGGAGNSGTGNSGTGNSGTGNAGGGTGGQSAIPPSCDPTKNASHDACPGGDCCEALTVNGGTFSRYYSINAPYDDPQYFADVSSYRLERFEVTVSRFRVFVDEYALPAPGDGEHPLIPDSGWPASLTPSLPGDRAALVAALDCSVDSSFTAQPGAFEAHPVNCVSWPVAFAFCAWDGGWLPTEAEWNYAASGGAEHRRYPWGPLPSGNDFTGYAVACSGFSNGVCGTPATLTAVGSLPDGAGRYGQEDLCGNVEEWTLDYYDEPLPMPCVDCAQLESSESMMGAFSDDRSLHGGSFESNQGALRAPDRLSSSPTTTSDARGFRCARSLN